MAVVNAEAELLQAAGRRGRPAARPARRRRLRRGLAAARCGRAVAVAGAAALLVAGVAVGVAARRGAAGRTTRTVVAQVDRRRPARSAEIVIIDDGGAARRARACPAPPAGRVYQVWLKRAGPARRSRPRAVRRSSATARPTVTCPGRLRRRRAVLVTDEPDGGSQAPTRRAADRRRPVLSLKRPRRRLLASPRMAVCYRHPDRETGVSCSNCGRPICPDCMTPTPVGMRCPECARQKTPGAHDAHVHVDPIGDLRADRDQRARVPRLGSGRRPSGSGSVVSRTFALFGPGAWPTASGGGWSPAASCTPASSTSRSTCTSCTSSARCSSRRSGTCASARCTSRRCSPARSARCCSRPTRLTVGASGAVFGLMGAAFVMQRARGINPMQSGLGPVILINLAFGFVHRPNISIGGHLGGLVGGALARAS